MQNTYIDHAIAEYKQLRPDPPTAESAAAEAVLQKPVRSRDMADLAVLEKTILILLPDDAVRRRAWQMRERYKQVMGDAVYASYIATNPPASDGEISDLRGDLVRLIDHLYRYYAALAYLETAQNRIVRVIFLVIFAAGIVVAGVVSRDLYVVYEGGDSFASLLPLIAFCGALGAFVSMINRFKKVGFEDPVCTGLALDHGRTTVYLSPLSGSLFAVLAYLFLVSGLVQSNWLPTLAEYVPSLTSSKGPVPIPSPKWAGPASAGDLARLLLVAFLAGFAERLLPDTIDRVIKRKMAKARAKLDQLDADPPPEPPPLPPEPPAGG